MLLLSMVFIAIANGAIPRDIVHPNFDKQVLSAGRRVFTSVFAEALAVLTNNPCRFV